MSDADQIKLATFAIRRLLIRIRDDEHLRYYAGVGTNTFEHLCAAYAAMTGEPMDEVMDSIIPGSSAITHPGVQETLEEAAA